MLTMVFSVFDRASGVYDRPWVAVSEQAAVRSFGDIANDETHPIGQHPEDYTLFRIGTYDDVSGSIVGGDPEKVINGVEAVSAHQNVVSIGEKGG